VIYKKICFVGPDVYPVLNRNYGSGYIGGESVQLTLLTKAFKGLNWDVIVIDRDYGQPDVEIIEEIVIHKTYKVDEGWPIIRFFHPRLSSIFKALKKADADIYFQSCAGMMTGLVALFCKIYKKKFVFRTAHDTDCIPGHQLIKLWRDKKLYEYGLRQANLISVQGENQKILLEKNYGINGFPVNMTVEVPTEIKADIKKDIDVLWVNNMRPFKRPEMCIEIAKSLRNYKFFMIGGPCPGFDDYYKKILLLSQKVNNLSFLGPVPYSQINSYFSRAKLFINTSKTEGFPNSFLQAWIRKVPIISFFDPDQLIKRHSLGTSPISIDTMRKDIVRLLSENKLRQRFGEGARKFVMKNYSPPQIAKKYISVFHDSGIITK
jgi:glycosyltransferase involved in cell wall biosynthesis